MQNRREYPLNKTASHTNGSGGDLWAITSFFNPMGYRRRLANFRQFRARLGLPLVAVELGFGPEFELQEGDAEILIQVRGGDVLFQKERLLNVARQALPHACRKFAWVDSDLLFGVDDWAERASRLLDRFPIAQLFSRMHYMPRDVSAGDVSIEAAEHSRISLASAVPSGLSAAECLDHANNREFGRYSPGFAWAARREIFDEHGFYDGCIVGGGDRAMACAYYGCFDHVIRRHCMHDRERERYLAWAKPFHDAVGGRVGFLDGDLFHLWHGALRDRKMHERHKGLSRFQFDPAADIAIGDQGGWRWNSSKPQMHDYVRGYFAGRNEDGNLGRGE